MFDFNFFSLIIRMHIIKVIPIIIVIHAPVISEEFTENGLFYRFAQNILLIYGTLRMLFFAPAFCSGTWSVKRIEKNDLVRICHFSTLKLFYATHNATTAKTVRTNTKKLRDKAISLSEIKNDFASWMYSQKQ